MTTTHKLVGERVNNPSKQQIKRIVGKAETLDGFVMKPGYLYTVVRAISARVNQNYDGWPSDELKKSYKTFIGKPVFVNHENYDPEKARGVVVAARYVEAGNDKYIEVIQEIDAKRFPKLAHEIRTGGLDSVSMGAEAGFTICSYCGNRATDVPDMCEHVLFHKGEKLSRLNRRTGRREDVLVYESCHKLSFFELSYVFDPADETAVASKVLVANARHKHAGECPPGQDCGSITPDTEQITPDSANNPLNQGGGSGASSASGAGASAGAGADLGKPEAAGGAAVSEGGAVKGLLPGAQGLKDLYLKDNPSADIGGYNPNVDQSWDEHATGKAIDYMNPSNPDQVKQQAFDNGANYVLWQQKQWNPDGSTSPMNDRGSPTENHMDHMHINVGSYERKVLKAAGFKTADKCHYCAGDAEEGFTSCAGHRKMEENKFKAAVLQAFRKGAPFADYKDFDDCTSKNSDKGDADAYCGEIKHRTEDKTGASANPFTDSSGRYQGPMKTKTSYPPSPYGNDDTCPECGKHFAQGHDASCSLASKWGARRSGEKTMDRTAAGRHQMPSLPGKHQAPFGYSPKEMPGQYQVMDGADFARAYDARPDEDDLVDAGPRHRASFEAQVLQAAGFKRSPGDRCLGTSASTMARGSGPMVRQAWGETEAPAAVDTLREEGSAPEDDNNDFYHYVEPPKELQTPDLSEAAQIDREQDESGQAAMDGQPGPASPDAGMAAPQQQYMELKIPIPAQGQAGAPGAGSLPMQPYQQTAPAPAPPGPPMGGPPPPQQVAASTRNYLDQYFGRRLDYSQEAMKLSNLSNAFAVSTTSRNTKGPENMARSTLASRGKTVTANRRQHFAEGPLVDSGDQSRNDQGEQEEVFITQTPPAEAVDAPTDDTPNISNTENNLVARVQRGRDQLLRDAQQLANFRAARRRTAGDQDEAGGPVATEVNPTVNTGPAGEELTGDDFESADPNAGVTETQPKDASLHAFKAFDKWLAASTGKPSRQHTSATIRRAADDFSRKAGISVQAMFPALGIVLREARKNEKAVNTKGAKVRKRAVDLEVAAPDGRVDVEAPVQDTTDAEAQASQFDINDFGNNAGDNIADPDLSTDQNWAPGEAKTSKVKTAGGILAFRCAEAMIAAGLEPNSAERKYALAAEFEHMNRGMVLNQTALCERFANVLANARRQVASGSTRGANLKPPVPSGLQGAQRTAGTNRVAANDPRNDSSMFI